MPSPGDAVRAAKAAASAAESNVEARVRNDVIGGVARDLALVFGVAWFAVQLLGD